MVMISVVMVMISVVMVMISVVMVMISVVMVMISVVMVMISVVMVMISVVMVMISVVMVMISVVMVMISVVMMPFFIYMWIYWNFNITAISYGEPGINGNYLGHASFIYEDKEKIKSFSACFHFPGETRTTQSEFRVKNTLLAIRIPVFWYIPTNHVV